MAAKLPPRIAIRPETGQWYVFYNQDGRDKRSSLRTKDRVTAETRFLGWLEQQQRNLTHEEDPTLNTCLDLWFEQHVEGLKTYNRQLSAAKNIRAGLGHLRISEIERRHSQQYAADRMSGRIGNKGASPSTVCLELGMVGTCLKFMCGVSRVKVEPREKRLPTEMMPSIDMPIKSPPRDRIISSAEMDLYYDFAFNGEYSGPGVARTNRVHRVQTFIILAAETAHRKTAITNLRWSDQVFFDRGKHGMINFLPAGAIQTNKRRPWVPISSTLRRMLDIAYEQRVNDYVLEKTTDIYSAFDRVNKILGIEGVSPHTFRHTWATNQIMAGKPIKKVAEFMGDTEETVRRNYEHLDPNYLADMVD